MLWTLAVIKPFDFLGLEAGEVVGIDPFHESPIRVISRHERPLPTNYGAIGWALEVGAVVPLPAQLRQTTSPRDLLHLVA